MRIAPELPKLCSWSFIGALVLGISGPAYSQSPSGPQPGPEKNDDRSIVVEAGSAPVAAPASPKPQRVSSDFSWTGAYVGGHVGYGWGRANTTFAPLPSAAQFVNLAPTTLHPDPKGVIGGGQVGYNWQTGRFVIGAEFDISASGMDGTATVTPIVQNNGTPFPGTGFLTAHQDTSWFGTLRPRLGVAPAKRLLVYGTAGLAFGHVNYSADSDFRPAGTEHYPAAFSKTKTGWTAGAGAEAAVAKRWSVRGEYLYYNLGSESAIINPAIPLPPFQVAYSWQTKAHTFNFGVNFRF